MAKAGTFSQLSYQLKQSVNKISVLTDRSHAPVDQLSAVIHFSPHSWISSNAEWSSSPFGVREYDTATGLPVVCGDGTIRQFRPRTLRRRYRTIRTCESGNTGRSPGGNGSVCQSASSGRPSAELRKDVMPGRPIPCVRRSIVSAGATPSGNSGTQWLGLPVSAPPAGMTPTDDQQPGIPVVVGERDVLTQLREPTHRPPPTGPPSGDPENLCLWWPHRSSGSRFPLHSPLPHAPSTPTGARLTTCFSADRGVVMSPRGSAVPLWVLRFGRSDCAVVATSCPESVTRYTSSRPARAGARDRRAARRDGRPAQALLDS